MLNVVPVQIQLILFRFVELEHGARHDSDVDAAHKLLAILHHDFLEHVAVDELVDEPAGTPHVLIDVGLQEPGHVGQSILLRGALLDCVVELHGELEDAELGLVYGFWGVLGAQVEASLARRLHFEGSLPLYSEACVHGAEQVIVLVAPWHFGRDDARRVPVQQSAGDEALVIVTEEVADVPVSMIVPLDLLVQGTVRCKAEDLGAELVVGFGFFSTISSGLLDRGCILVGDEEGLVRQLALVDQYVGVPHAHHWATVAKATHSLLSSERLGRDLGCVEVPDPDVVEFVPLFLALAFQLKLLLLFDIRIVVATVGRSRMDNDSD